MVTMKEVWMAYEEAKGCWHGCTWPTHYGSMGLDLHDISSCQAQHKAARWRAIAGGSIEEVSADEEASLVDMALHLGLGGVVVCVRQDPEHALEVECDSARRCCADALASEWEFASCWLEEIELDAVWAEAEAFEAVHAAEDGDWADALAHVRQACLIESGYQGREPWRRLKRVIEEGELDEHRCHPRP